MFVHDILDFSFVGKVRLRYPEKHHDDTHTHTHHTQTHTHTHTPHTTYNTHLEHTTPHHNTEHAEKTKGSPGASSGGLVVRSGPTLFSPHFFWGWTSPPSEPSGRQPSANPSAGPPPLHRPNFRSVFPLPPQISFVFPGSRPWPTLSARLGFSAVIL